MSPTSAWILQEEVRPRLRSAIPTNVNQIGSQDSEELIQDSVCIAAKLLISVWPETPVLERGEAAGQLGRPFFGLVIT